MDRLTNRVDGIVQTCLDWDNMPSHIGEDVQELAERLAEYEDTGLTPKEIVNLKVLLMQEDNLKCWNPGGCIYNCNSHSFLKCRMEENFIKMCKEANDDKEGKGD